MDALPVVAVTHSLDLSGLSVQLDLNGVGLRDHRMAPGRALLPMTPDEMVDLARDLLVAADWAKRHGAPVPA